MLEKVYGALPDWVKQKLVLRMIYTSGSFVTARIIAFLSGEYVNHGLQVVVLGLGKIGIKAIIQIVSIDKQILQACITGALMIAGEWVIEHVHTNVVQPLDPQKEPVK